MIERIHIERLQVDAHVGVSAEERSKRQLLLLNVTLFPYAGAVVDELAETIDYSALAEMVRDVGARGEYMLIETLAENVVTEVMTKFAALRVKVEVRKFVLPDADYVSVTAVREALRE